MKHGMGDEKRLIRVIKDSQENELRQVTVQVKTDYKKAKQQLKQVRTVDVLVKSTGSFTECF